MPKKLRLRFLLISWGLLLLFLTALCCGVSLYLYQSAVNETEAALRKAVETETLTDETRGMAGLRLGANGDIVHAEQSHLSLSEETLHEIVLKMNIRDEQGIGQVSFEGKRYRYLVILQGGGAWAAIAECTQEQALAKTLRRNTVIFILLGMLLMMPVCALLASWFSKPIETAWEKQNDFVSDATHELKTPLTVIAANTEAVLSNPEAPIETQERFLDSIKDETARMAGLVGDLLFLAKIDAGEIHLDLEPIDISEMLEGMCMERESDLFEAGCDFDYELTPELTYQGDRKRIEQMMNALLDNAQMYTPEGGSIRMVVNHDRKQQLRIVLSNSGNPIPEQELGKIFERFYRVDPSRARETGGYGLGLCVARSIAVLHGGSLTADCSSGVNVFTAILGTPPEQKNEKP
ncbi:MAG: hypothetical protein IJ060_11780 [Oscillospiraceae bacterium]|nr:hypothetical protein [Oscillospiraceae bacterium]